MGNRIQALTHVVFKKSTSDCTLEEIKQAADKYPYFAATQIILLHKQRELHLQDASMLADKSILYFHNPLLFDYYFSGFTPNDSGEIDPAALRDHQQDSIDSSSYNGSQKEAEIENEETKSEPSKGNTTETDFTELESLIEFEDKTSNNTIDELNFVREDAPPEEESVQVAPVEANTDNQNKQEELLFEPYHAVDYFASQGIQVSAEDLTKDKLGRGLKSFTEWLKTMKRLPASQINQNLNSQVEKTVEKLADVSVGDTTVVTEAMAEVWAKQGNADKAIEVYDKLSLQNPSKRAYFAAKIENLKPEK